MTRAEKIASKKLDEEIARVYGEACDRITIPMMQIPAIYREARKARAEGRDMRAAIVAYVETIRVDL